MIDDVVAKADSVLARCAAIADQVVGDFHLAAAARTLIPELRDEVLRLRDLSDHNFEAAAQLQTEIERLHTWDGLMSVLNEHYWESVFPTLPDDPDRDPGPRIVSLIRTVDGLRAEVERLTEQLIDARVAHINTVMALRNSQAHPPSQRHHCAGMTPEAFAAYLADPREFVRQQIKDGK